MTTIDLSKTYINLDIVGTDNELMIANYQTSRAVIQNPSQYDISILSCDLNLKIPQIWINMKSDLYKNLCVGFCGGFDGDEVYYYKNVQTTNVQKIMYALRDKSFDYINPDVFCISNENFFKALNLSFNIIMNGTPSLKLQGIEVNYRRPEYYRYATIPPYFEYNNINDIKFYRMLITPPVAINGGVGWFYSYELAKIFETLFGNYDIQTVNDYDGKLLGYINITDRFDIAQFPDDRTASYVVDAKTLKNPLGTSTPMRHDIYPEGGGPPFVLDNYEIPNNKSSIGYWSYTPAAKYSFNNVYSYITEVPDNFSCWGFPFPDPDSANGATKNNKYANTFVKNISLDIAPFTGTALNYNRYPTDAFDNLLNVLKYENDFVNLTNIYDGDVIIIDGELSLNQTTDYFETILLGILTYNPVLGVSSTYLFPVLERLTITSVCTFSQLINPIQTVDILAYGLSLREDLVLNSTNTDMVLRPVLKSYILDPDTIESSDYSLTDFPNGEILRTDMLGVNPINQVTIQLYAYSDDGIYFPLKSYGVSSSIKLMFSKKKI